MSLIQEALRRRDEEQGREGPGTGRPVQPPPRVDVPRRADKARGHRVGVIVVVVVLVMVVVGGTVYFMRETPVPRADGRVDVAVVAPSPAPVPPAVSTVVISTRPQEVVPEIESEPMARSEIRGIDESPGLGALSREEVTAVVPSRPEPAPEVAPVSPPVGEPEVLGRIFPPEEKKELLPPGIWPRLRVTGVLTMGDKNTSSAVIDGELIGVGEDLQGVRLLRVENSGVWLEHEGETRFIKVGRRTR